MEVIHVTVIFFHVNHKLVYLAMTKIMCYLLFSRINHVLWTITVVMPLSLALVVVIQPPGLVALSGFDHGHGCGSSHGRCVDLAHWQLAGIVGATSSN
jgi:hypothetical protein